MEKQKKYVVTITRQFGSLGRPIASFRFPGLMNWRKERKSRQKTVL